MGSKIVGIWPHLTRLRSDSQPLRAPTAPLHRTESQLSQLLHRVACLPLKFGARLIRNRLFVTSFGILREYILFHLNICLIFGDAYRRHHYDEAAVELSPDTRKP
jgi:hypothetical protein